MGITMNIRNDTIPQNYIKESNNRDIAVIGISAKFPMAEDIKDFWNNISCKMDCISKLPAVRKKFIDEYNEYLGKDLAYNCMNGGYLQQIHSFDHDFFSVSPNEAKLMAPQQRLVLETAWSAFEDAGYRTKELSNQNVAVYMGHIGDLESYKYKEMIESIDSSNAAGAFTGTLPAITSGRISNLLNINGPNFVIDSACSSSLVSIATACQALRNRTCDMALVTSVRINLVPIDDVRHKIGIESADYMTRAFDDNSEGSGMGEGVAAIVLKPLWKAVEDKDNIYALIKGYAVNQDGRTASLTAPNPSAQEDLLVKAWMDSGVDPRTISYMELHGTGTKLGDPIEIQAIRQAFARFTKDKQFCAVSTVKSNIGHLYECSGLAGFIKATLSLKNKVLPASLHFMKPNQNINLCDSPVYINTNTRYWEADKHPRRCGISSFGLSGTNCHIILEEYKDTAMHHSKANQQNINILTVSAKTLPALFLILKSYMNFLMQEEINLENFLFTANTGRDIYEYKVAIHFIEISDVIQIISKVLALHDFSLDIPSFYYNHTKKKTACNTLQETMAKETVCRYAASDCKLLEAAKEICSLYIQGIGIDWNELYVNKDVNKISIPAYSFCRQPFWMDIPKVKKNDIMYSMEWSKDEKAALRPIDLSGKAILVLGGYQPLLEGLSSERYSVIWVELGEKYLKKDENYYIIASQYEDYCHLFEELKTRNISHIIHSHTGKPIVNHMDDITEELNKGVFSLFYIVKAIFACGLSGRIDITIITYLANRVTGKEFTYKPSNGALDGLGKVISKEYPTITCRCFDVDESTTADELLAELIIRRKDYHVAFRNHIKYFEYMTELPIDRLADDTITIRNDGVYLITGGTGNIGLIIAKHMACFAPKCICLLHRTPLPERNLWESILKEKKDKKLLQILQTFLDIEKKGVTVFSYTGDIASYESLKEIICKIQKECGKIAGIIHAAGVPGKGLLFTKTKEDFTRVLNPKTLGTYYLDLLTREDKPDFMLLFSSGISTIGEIGQGDYTAANCFLDTYSYLRNRSGLRTTAIDWVVWKNSRMLEGKSVIIDGIFKALSTVKALNAFDTILRKKTERVFVGEINPIADERNNYIGDIPFDVPKAIRIKTQKNNKSIQQNTVITLDGRYGDQYSEEEKIVAGLYNKILGYSKLNIHDSFFEIGGNSIQISQLYAELQELYPGRIKVSDLFQYTSINKLAEFVSNKPIKQVMPNPASSCINEDEIAIIGMAVNLPEADTLKEYWNNIVHGVDCTKKIPRRRREYLDNYLKIIGADSVKPSYMICSYLDNIDEFDYSFFHISPKEAKRMDPGQRLFLQTAWHAIEDAGYSSYELSESRTGVYLGYANIYKDSYQKMIYDVSPEYFEGAVIGNLSAAIPARISYLLNLKGPSMLVDTACSSSLASVHLACNSIRSGDCDMAIAGGLKLFILPFLDERFHLGIESPDGKTRSFDANSDGAGMGEGVAAIVLKPLSKAREDKDCIYAVIKGSSLNQDGATQGLTAPNPSAQTDVIIKAWENAKVHPDTIAYFEAHGTGTSLGDPIEIEGLSSAFQKYTDKKQFCAIGSAKTSIGHLNECSGIAGLIKAVLIANNHQLPPTRNFNRPNQKIEFADSPVYVNTHLRNWEKREVPMRCAISSFGLSGTNCHVILEEYQKDNSKNQLREYKEENNNHIFTLSALTGQGLLLLVRAFLTYLEPEPFKQSIKEICFTAANGRDDYIYRLAIPVHSVADLIQKLTFVETTGLKTLEEFDIFYGYKKTSYTEEEKHKHANMDEIVLQILKCSDTTQFLSNEEVKLICQYYADGGAIEWARIYPFHKIRRVHLPLYPFEKNTCWIPLSITETETSEGLYHSMKWELDSKSRDLIDWKAYGKHVLIIADKSQRLNEFLSLLETGNYKYTVCQPHTAEHLVENDLIQYQVVVFMMFNHSDAIKSLRLLEESQEQGVYQLFALAKRFIQSNSKKQIDFVLLSDSIYKVRESDCIIKPQAASLFGLGKVLNKECNSFFCRCIDADVHTKLEDTINDIFDFGTSYQSAYRNGNRYVQVFTEANLKSSRPKISIRKHGVYVITGGTGDLALEAALFLSAKTPVTIILLSRSVHTPSNQVLCRTMEAIREKGSKVIVYQNDITKIAQTKEILDEVRKNHGPIQGIIHTAGVTETKPLAKKDLLGFKKVMEPKIQGTWIMDTLTREDALDFFVVFTSTATICYSSEQCDYVAANAFMEAYCTYRNIITDNSIVIHWTTWKETGMAARQNFNIDTIFKTISTKDAIAAFDFILKHNISQVAIGEINYDSSMVQLLEKYPFHLSPTIKKRIQQREKTCKENRPLKNITAKDDTLKVISGICREYLELTHIAEEDNFFELGCDSILLKQIYQRLDQIYPDVLQITDLFEYSTIKKLSEYLSAQVMNAPILETASAESDRQIEKLLEDMETGKEDVNQIIDKLMNL